MSRAAWNEPLMVTESKTEIAWDGQQYRGRLDWVICDEDFQLIREGRKCLECMEVFKGSDGMSIAWPTECPVCGYQVASRQARDLGPEYHGEVRVGPRTSDSDEIDRMEHEAQSRIWTPGRSASIPRDLGP